MSFATRREDLLKRINKDVRFNLKHKQTKRRIINSTKRKMEKHSVSKTVPSSSSASTDNTHFQITPATDIQHILNDFEEEMRGPINIPAYLDQVQLFSPPTIPPNIPNTEVMNKLDQILQIQQQQIQHINTLERTIYSQQDIMRNQQKQLNHLHQHASNQHTAQINVIEHLSVIKAYIARSK